MGGMPVFKGKAVTELPSVALNPRIIYYASKIIGHVTQTYHSRQVTCIY